MLTIIVFVIIIVIILISSKILHKTEIDKTVSRYETKVLSLKLEKENYKDRLKSMEKCQKEKVQITIPLDWVEEFLKMFDEACKDGGSALNSYKLWKIIERKFPKIQNKEYNWKIHFGPMTKPSIVGKRKNRFELELEE